MATAAIEVGFLGLGQMGGAMAGRLLGAGVGLAVFDPSAAAVARLVGLGATACRSAAEVAEAADIVIACLPNGAVSQSVLAGPDGVLAGSRMSAYVETSTIGTQALERVAAAVAGRGVGFLDAPISGGPPGARAGTLVIMAAGAVSVLERVRPVLAHLGRAVVHVGERPGLGQAMKLVNNLLAASHIAALCEALTLGAKAGLEAGRMAEVINAGTGRSMVSETMLPSAMLTGSFDFGATIAVMEKDVALGAAEAARLGVPTWVLEQSARVWRFAVTQGMAGEDITALLRLNEGWTGTEVRGPMGAGVGSGVGGGVSGS